LYMIYNLDKLGYTPTSHNHLPFLSDGDIKIQQKWSRVDSANESICSKVDQNE
jgi:hypothetical protein